jgi:hypothetical protein
LLAEGVGVDRGGRELVVPAAAERLHLRGEGREESAEVEGRGKEGEPAAENTSSARRALLFRAAVFGFGPPAPKLRNGPRTGPNTPESAKKGRCPRARVSITKRDGAR